MSEEYTPFDFIKSASFTKKDLVKESEVPYQTEKQYIPHVVNRGFSYFEDTILHANEMNKLNGLFKDAQYRYYLGSLRQRNRFSKWLKLEKNEELDIIQQHYQCNRTVAQQYLKVLTKDNIIQLKSLMNKGG